MNRSGWCRPCTQFASRYPGTGPCGACGRQQPLKKGHCRLCWCQARLDRPETTPRQHQNLLPWAQRVRCHQLFFAGMPGPRDLVVRGAPRCGVRSTRLAGGPPAAAGGRDGCLQLPLFADVPRAYRYGRIDLRTDAVPGNPWLARALHLAHTTAEARGWDSQMLGTLNRTLAVVLSGYAEGTMIKVSEFRPALRKRGDSITRTAQILDAMGILADDRPAAFDQWLAARLGGLAPGISGEASRWARALHDGTPRTPPLHDKTVRSYVAALRPALLEWSARHGHLREITRDDVRAVTAQLHGPRRQTTLVAARSLFACARKNGVIFRDPASRLRVGRTGHAIFQPLLPGQIDQAVEAATTPHARVFVALAAVHAARPAQIRALQLSDADLGNRRLTIAGRTRPLDDLTYQVLLDWFTTRQARWPNTANPHLLISRRTAPGTGPVSHAWLRSLRGLPATLDRLRIDRQLEEALTHGADPLHLAVVFGLDDTTAVRYAASARQLLARPHETGPSVPAGTPASGPLAAAPDRSPPVPAGQGPASGAGTRPT
jgi:hypothetical protein